MLTFPLFKPEDIEIRFDRRSEEFAEFSVYKNVRSDWKYLDQVVGRENWQCTYRDVGGRLFCAISIWDGEKNSWVTKENNGTPGDFEPVKAEASDAFKRAAFVWGIGKELYSAPDIRIPVKELEWADGKSQRLKSVLIVKEIEYNEDRKISYISITDKGRKGQVVYSWGKKANVEEPHPFEAVISIDCEYKGVNYKGRQLGEVYAQNNARMIFKIAKEDPQAGDAAKQCIKGNPKLLELWEKEKEKRG